MQIRFYQQGTCEFEFDGVFSVITFDEQKLSIEGNIKFPVINRYFMPLRSFGLSNEAHGEFRITSELPYLLIRSDGE